MIRLLIVGAVRLYREGLTLILARYDDLVVVGTAADPLRAAEMARTFHADVALFDMATRDNLGAVGRLMRDAPSVRVVALALPEDEERLVACVEAGVAGYVSRDGSLDDLVSAIRSCAQGEVLCSPRMAAGLFRRLHSLAAGGLQGTGRHLTPREQQVAQLVRQGLTNKEIARALHIALPTVKNHVHHILEKLQVRRRSDLLTGYHSAEVGEAS